jgi:NTE family protein
MWADAVFESGGVKGIGLVGALCVAEEKGFTWRKLAGSSAGSIIAALLSADYTGKELHVLLEQDFTDFLTPTWPTRFPYVGAALRIWIRKGLYSGVALERWVEQLLAAKGIRTFGDLKERELYIIASDVTRGELLVLPKDLPAYGWKPEEFPIARAVRMSCSIPFMFEPAKLLHKPDKKVSLVVDGAVLSNFPVWLFDREEPRWPSLGFRLISEEKELIHEIRGPFSLFRSILYTMMDAHDNRYVHDHDQIRTIMVPAHGIKFTDFSISTERKKELFESGVKAAEAFFQNWTFDKYLEARGKRNQVSYTLRPTKQRE